MLYSVILGIALVVASLWIANQSITVSDGTHCSAPIDAGQGESSAVGPTCAVIRGEGVHIAIALLMTGLALGFCGVVGVSISARPRGGVGHPGYPPGWNPPGTPS